MGASSIDKFSMTFDFISSISTGAGTWPHGVIVYDSKIYVSFRKNGNIAVISNNIITNFFTTQCLGLIPSLTFYIFGYMAVVCYSNSYMYSFDSSANYLNQFIRTRYSPFNADKEITINPNMVTYTF